MFFIQTYAPPHRGPTVSPPPGGGDTPQFENLWTMALVMDWILYMGQNMINEAVCKLTIMMFS
jgi:hypothetical protein